MNVQNNIFAVATRKKYRFSYKGWISVEELWDMDLKELDSVYKWLKSLEKRDSEDSLISKDKPDVDLQNKLQIVKYVFETKQTEIEEKKAEAENAEKKKKILEILAKKQDESLLSASEEDLKKMLDELD